MFVLRKLFFLFVIFVALINLIEAESPEITSRKKEKKEVESSNESETVVTSNKKKGKTSTRFEVIDEFEKLGSYGNFLKKLISIKIIEIDKLSQSLLTDHIIHPTGNHSICLKRRQLG